MAIYFRLAALFLVFFLTSCTSFPPGKDYTFKKANWSELNFTEKNDDNSAYFINMMQRNINFLARKKSYQFIFQDYSFSSKDFILASEQALRNFQDGINIKQAIKKNFDLIKLVSKKKPLFTGYYMPVINASKVQSREYSVPVYGTPTDLITVNLGDFDEKYAGKKILGRIESNKLKPYWNRKQISQESKLAENGLEIAWVKDIVDLFYIEIQGSGFLNFPDGSTSIIHFNQQNGRPYRAIGTYLMKIGAITKDQASMQNIRNWLIANPHRLHEVLNYNESFVFFKLEDDGPFGNTGIKLTPMHSVAADQSIYPAGSLMIIDLPSPKTPSMPFTQVVAVQDVGGAIKSEGRIDIYWGEGHEAGNIAGNTKQIGDIYLLLPKIIAKH